MRTFLFFTVFASVLATSCDNSRNNPNNPGGYNNVEPPRQKTPEELREELLMLEKQNPKDYLRQDGTYRENFWGEMVLEGTITNSATMANFKDVVLKISWLSKTGTKLGTVRETVYEFVKAGKSVAYKIKFAAPTNTKSVSVDVYSASVAE